MKRGEIYYIRADQSETGSEQRANRPGVIVSNDINNKYSATVEVVYLTTQPKSNLPTHVRIYSAPRPSTALCEQVTTVAVSRLEKYLGRCSRRELNRIDKAMMVSLGIEVV